MAGRRLVDPNTLCMGCMKELVNPKAACPYCGFVPMRYQKKDYFLPLYEILNGKYLVGKAIGVGGFGITYIGWDFYQSKRVCIKEYFPMGVAERDTTHMSTATYSVDVHTDFTERNVSAYQFGLKSYINEAKTLSHFYDMPGIVSVRDFFYGNRTAYIVMEYIDGFTMKTLAKIRGGRVQPEIVLGLLDDVILALAKVHKEDIIHRDISPDNIMVSKENRAKLIDFGTAKDYLRDVDQTVFLKHGYAPVEQYKKNSVQGPWTDVYSMCASIYTLMSGVKLQNSEERQKKDRILPLQAVGVPISEELDRVILKGLSIEPPDRYQSMEELHDALYSATM